jgi:hypothetical protein
LISSWSIGPQLLLLHGLLEAILDEVLVGEGADDVLLVVAVEDLARDLPGPEALDAAALGELLVGPAKSVVDFAFVEGHM